MKFTRTRYQQGCLTTETRQNGPDVWVFLWRESDSNGTRRQRKHVVGTIEQYRSVGVIACIPEILTVDELKALMPELQQPYLSMVVIAAVTGLRRSEIFALKWSDVDFDAHEIRLSRAIVHQVVGEMKTEASKKPVSMEPELAGLLDD